MICLLHGIGPFSLGIRHLFQYLRMVLFDFERPFSLYVYLTLIPVLLMNFGNSVNLIILMKLVYGVLWIY